ncbi:nucleoside triphosphate hydrolase protein [Wolfiporia cocos MD-104 SS10]|uniref:Nucleoside triphosphate hydrolase protein n=1 Tax=Wolfiporia cocos (strain MD-104) TaxID=742152 RepID=A0A2H3JVS4_WOLCO|nr:nucleoside triphosphate hydrolase protein [Wolfiporia cocos MD-104 SS10]
MSTIRRAFATSPAVRHDNPLGLPARRPAPQIPRRGGPIQKRPLPYVRKVLAVASGKGGVGKSTVAVNLALSLAMQAHAATGAPARVGILDLDIFGPSVPKLMGLDAAPEPRLTQSGAIVPLTNHGLPCMSMGLLLPREANADTAVVWRGLMVQKAVQQLLFDIDWREPPQEGGAELDVLVLDLPPGTGDVPLTLGQLVNVDGAVIVSTPQDVALSDVRKGVTMFQKISVPITGLLLNQSHFLCPSCATPHHLFGSPERFHATAASMGVPVLGALPLVPAVSEASDGGAPFVLAGTSTNTEKAGVEWRETMAAVAKSVWRFLGR